MDHPSSQSTLPPVVDGIAPDTRSGRLVSVDAFRGLTIALMVLVNDAGGPVSYSSLQHSQWNGWTLTDTVFPSFLWIVGIAITLSFAKRVAAGVDRKRLLRQVLQRAVILYALGAFLYLFPQFHFGTMRILGVLQRIALCYLAASCIYLTSGIRAQVLWIVGLLATYWAAMTLIPVPGYGPGNLSVEGNFAHYVDQLILGRHNYTPTKTWDPEGIISTLPAIATTLLGIIAGHVLRLHTNLRRRVTWLVLMGAALLTAGLICSVWLPINKKIWTDSFALFMAGLDCVVFAAFLWFVDGLHWRRIVRPFVIFGMNAIAVYVASELVAIVLDWIQAAGMSIHDVIYRSVFQPIGPPKVASLCYALTYVLVMYVLAYVLYKRWWFIKV